MMVNFLLLVLFGMVVVEGRGLQDIDTTVEALFRTVESLQVKKDRPFEWPLIWEKHKGMYESDVKFYFHGAEDMFLFREAFKVYDDNMFATSWITICLLETFLYGNGPKPSEEQIISAILSIREYHDKNVDFSNSLMTFWPQKYNATEKAWQSYPVNLHHFFSLAGSMNATDLEKLLEKIGLKDIAAVVDRLMKMKDGYLKAFMIPPDFDDTFVNLGLGSLLTDTKQYFPETHAQWISQNTNITSIYDALKRYAYRPMSSNNAINTIDCRTYFYLRFFLEEAKSRNEDIALVSTWAQDIDELKKWGPRGVNMPLNTNNIDVTVAANGVYGTTSAILNGLLEPDILDDPEIRQIYLNTSSLIAFMIETNFSSRHDLALLYYPSEFEFYWFVARTFSELQRHSKKGPLPHTVLETVQKILEVALHDHMTSAVLNATQRDLTDNTVYFDDFVGDGDLDLRNHPKRATWLDALANQIRGEDRLFTTAMAINALLTTWTVFDDTNRKLVWEKGTPSEVKDTVTKAASFINKHILGLSYQPWNAFFSGSVKGNTTWPYYPINRFKLSTTDNNSGASHGTPFYVLGFQGVASEAEYQSLLKRKWLGQYTPLDFHGYNNYPDYWPFWSSEPYTYVTSMLALAKFSNTVEQ